ncbi:MAG: tetratricopeptide repeat protein [Capsulimonadales bacterium]|nr:tetratricopeptide repeat protein [Capsulimonadales bacterium]
MAENGAGSALPGRIDDPKEAGTALLKQGKFEEAAAVLREAVALDNNDEVAWRLLGGALASKGDANGAVEAFRNAVRIVPMAARSHYNLGLALQSAGRLPEAKSSFERAVSLDPGHDPARTRLGEVAEQLGVPRPATPNVPAEGHTNIGGGNATGLASISSPGYAAQQAQQTQPSPAGHTNIGGGNATGLLSIGAHREAAPPPAGGHSNIGGGNATGLSSVGMASSAPQDTGHTNIGGGNASMLGSVGPGGTPTLRPGTAPAGHVPSVAPPPSASPSAFAANVASSYPGASNYAPPPVLGQNYQTNLVNTSGMQGDVPFEVSKPFNWGAFLLTWQGWGFIWAFNMRLTTIGAAMVGVFFVLPILIGIVGAASASASGRDGGGSWTGIVSLLLGFVQFGFGIYLGINGNKLAWQNRNFASVEDFHQCQRTWTYWAVGLMVAGLVIGFLLVLILGAAMMAVLSGGGRSLNP